MSSYSIGSIFPPSLQVQKESVGAGRGQTRSSAIPTTWTTWAGSSPAPECPQPRHALRRHGRLWQGCLRELPINGPTAAEVFGSSKLEGAERGEAGWPPADVDRPFLALSVGISVDDVVSGMLDIEGDLPERLFDDSTPSQATLTAPCSDEAQERRRHGAPAVPEEAAAHRRAPPHARRIRQRDRRRMEGPRAQRREAEAPARKKATWQEIAGIRRSAGWNGRKSNLSGRPEPSDGRNPLESGNPTPFRAPTSADILIPRTSCHPALQTS